jgi:hypothetical protein
MALGPQTAVIDGSRFAVPTSNAYQPVGFGQLVQPQPIQNVNFPPMVTGGGGGAGSLTTEQVGGYGTAGQNVFSTIAAAANPWNPKHSPLWWAVIGLILAIVLLSAVHWRRTTLAGAGENLHIGEARERGEVEV